MDVLLEPVTDEEGDVFPVHLDAAAYGFGDKNPLLCIDLDGGRPHEGTIRSVFLGALSTHAATKFCDVLLSHGADGDDQTFDRAKGFLLKDCPQIGGGLGLTCAESGGAFFRVNNWEIYDSVTWAALASSRCSSPKASSRCRIANAISTMILHA